MKQIFTTIRPMIETASTTSFSLSVKQLIDFFHQAAIAVATILDAQGIKPVCSTKAVIYNLKQLFLIDNQLKDDVDFSSDRDALQTIFEEAYSLSTVSSYREQFEPFIAQLMNDADYAHKYFFCTDQRDGDNIAGLRGTLLKRVRQKYGYTLSPDVVSSWIYTHLWENGWANLMKYNYEASFTTWLTTVASRRVIQILRDEGLIPEDNTPKMRLLLRHKSAGYCKLVIDSMLPKNSSHQILTLVYVYRHTKADAAKILDMDVKSFEHELNKAKNQLIKRLNNIPNDFTDVLDTSNHKVKVSSELISKIRLLADNEHELLLIYDALGIEPDDIDAESKIVNFLWDFSNELKWTQDFRYVWQCRFLEGLTPTEVADSLPGRSRAWVDDKFSKGNVVFRNAIREWWKQKTI